MHFLIIGTFLSSFTFSFSFCYYHFFLSLFLCSSEPLVTMPIFFGDSVPASPLPHLGGKWQRTGARSDREWRSSSMSSTSSSMSTTLSGADSSRGRGVQRGRGRGRGLDHSFGNTTGRDTGRGLNVGRGMNQGQGRGMAFPMFHGRGRGDIPPMFGGPMFGPGMPVPPHMQHMFPHPFDVSDPNFIPPPMLPPSLDMLAGSWPPSFPFSNVGVACV